MITAVYGGDSDSLTSPSSALTVTVGRDTTSTSVTASASPAVFGQSETLTASVKVSTPGAGTPSGTVTFLDGSAKLGSGALDANGQVTVRTTKLSLGAHTIKVVYSGSANDLPSNSPALSLSVKRGAAASVTSSTRNTVFGQSISLTATVMGTGSGAPTPSGTVSFFDGTTLLGKASLVKGRAVLATTKLAVGTNPITVNYSGDSTFAPAHSAILSQTVRKAATAITIASSANPSVFGQTVTMTATVTVVKPGGGTPTGTVRFMAGSKILGTAPLHAGKAALSVATLALGTHPITAAYSGDGSFTAITSKTLTQTVKVAGTKTVLSASSTSVKAGKPLTLTATVKVAVPGTGTAAGTVTFEDAGKVLGSITLDDGSAVFKTSSLSKGTHRLTAVYAGNANNAKSTSAAITVTVNS
jgi:hypothetical protein